MNPTPSKFWLEVELDVLLEKLTKEPISYDDIVRLFEIRELLKEKQSSKPIVVIDETRL